MAAIMLLQSCGDFMEEYSQDLKRVQSVDDLSELLMGECMLPLSLYESDSYVEISNENFMLLHFMSDELQETLIMDDDVDMAKIREKYFPYFTWQGNCCIDYQGKNSLENDEDDFWNLAYNRINNCNMVIKACDDLEVSHPDDLALKERIKGECYYLRATYYYMLANLYGKPYAPQTAQQTPCVPIKTSANIEDKEYTRNSVAEVYAQIKEDLAQAENILKNAPAPPTDHLSCWHWCSVYFPQPHSIVYAGLGRGTAICRAGSRRQLSLDRREEPDCRQLSYEP